MYCRRSWLLPLCLILAFSTTCTRNTQRLTPQLAVLQFENLSSDPSADWMGRAFSEIISTELTGSPQQGVISWPSLHGFDAVLGVRPRAPGISTERTQALVAGAGRAVYGYFSLAGGMLHATAMEEDLASRKMIQTASASGPASDGIVTVADALARHLGDTRSFGTRNVEALHNYAAALDAPDAATAFQDFAQSIAADPNFGRAYVLWTDGALARHNRPQAALILADARAHWDRLPEPDRAALDLDGAFLRGDFHAQIEARRELVRLDPANPNHHRALAETLMGVRDYDGAILEFRRALTLRPDDILALNTMGYAAAFSGDLPTAIRVLRGYEQRRPKEPNPLDSLGDVHYALGHFREAEQFYLAANERSRGFLNGGELLKAAQARLMTGDVAGATALFHRYLDERQAAHDPNASYNAAAWSWATGARRGAIDSMDRIARGAASGPLRELAGRADAQAALWLLELGDRPGAIDHARRAVGEAVAANAAIIALTAFLVQPEQFPEPPQLPARAYAQAYALLFARQFAPAAGALQEIYAQPASELDNGLSVLLAWAYLETGQWQKAAPLLRLTPLPQGGGFPLFASLDFPRIFSLRGAVLERQGHPNEAAAYRSLFGKLSGPDATIWDHDSLRTAR